MSARKFCYQIEREGYHARIVLLISLVSLLALTGCNNANGDPASQEAPPAAKVIVTRCYTTHCFCRGLQNCARRLQEEIVRSSCDSSTLANAESS